MAADPISAVPTPSAVDRSSRPEAERAAIKQLAQEFEALLMTQMLREMRRSMLDDEDRERGFGAGPLTDTIDAELARALSRVGGFGLGDSLLGAFSRVVAAPEAAGVNAARTTTLPGAGPADAAPTAVDMPSGAGEVSLAVASAPVSSAFGWRADPVTGVARFHRGIDLAIAYGQDVKAAAPGRVVFAGRQRGYGNTVVIEHGEGRQTRYAHLSQQLVQRGDEVAGGQVLGKSGSSGRSTGPHLHFEVLVNGRPIDPGKPVKSE